MENQILEGETPITKNSGQFLEAQWVIRHGRRRRAGGCWMYRRCRRGAHHHTFSTTPVKRQHEIQPSMVQYLGQTNIRGGFTSGEDGGFRRATGPAAHRQVRPRRSSCSICSLTPLLHGITD